MNHPHHPISILVAHHDRWTRHSLIEMLRESGFGVREASNGMAALRTAAVSPPHIVLIGRRLPEVSMLEVVRTLRADARTRHTAVVHVRAAADASVLGVDGVLDLPCNAIELLATVIEALEARHSTDVLARRLNPAQAGAAYAPRNAGVPAVHRARTLETLRVTGADCRD